MKSCRNQTLHNDLSSRSEAHCKDDIVVVLLLSVLMRFRVMPRIGKNLDVVTCSSIDHKHWLCRILDYEQVEVVNTFDNHNAPDKGVSKLCLLNELDDSLLLVASCELLFLMCFSPFCYLSLKPTSSL